MSSAIHISGLTKVESAKWHALNEKLLAAEEGNLTSSILVNDTPAKQRERQERARFDVPFLMKTYFPHYCTKEVLREIEVFGNTEFVQEKVFVKPGKFQLDFFKKLDANPKARIGLAWPRGHAKSVLATLIAPIRKIIRDELHTMLLMGSSEDASKRLVNTLKHELETNALLIHDFGPFKSPVWTDSHFVTRNNVAVFALGFGQSPRGIRNRQYRPDFIVVDDVDKDKACESVVIMDAAYRFFQKAIVGTLSMGRGQVVVCNNIIHHNSLQSQLRQTQGWDVQVLRARDEDGNPIWPENFTREEIEAEYERLGADAATELDNDPPKQGHVFTNQELHYYGEQSADYIDHVLYIDPSYTSKDTSDNKAFWLCSLAETGKRSKKYEYHYHKCWSDHCEWSVAAQAVEDVLNDPMYSQWNIRVIMEANGPQGGAIELMNSARHLLNLPPIHIEPFKHKFNKNARIARMAGNEAFGLIRFNPTYRDNPNDPYWKAFLRERQSFDDRKRNNVDDSLDCYSGGYLNLETRVNADAQLKYWTT